MNALDWTSGSPYQGYLYSYPHKTAYRAIEPARSLDSVWAAERRDSLFLYAHVPFCSIRCGFCNLFTTANGASQRVAPYLAALDLQARVLADVLGSERQFARVAIGGGTPSFLSVSELRQLLDTLAFMARTDLSAIPSCIEASPDTFDDGKAALVAEYGIERVSLGVQTFDETEAKALGRPQRTRDVLDAVARVRRVGVPILNLDLIYGGEGQTLQSWEASLEAALALEPDQLYLYPLYVRQFTGLHRRTRSWDDERLERYRLGRDLLISRGFRQHSMRFFEKSHPTSSNAPPYRCQEDGMVGLGVGARSYTTHLHYSSQYAVTAGGTQRILDEFSGKSAEQHRTVCHGFVLDTAERQRRHLILSLLTADGLERAAYRATFGADVLEHFPELQSWLGNWLTADADCLRLTARGLERSDALGPALISAKVRTQMEGYAWT